MPLSGNSYPLKPIEEELLRKNAFCRQFPILVVIEENVGIFLPCSTDKGEKQLLEPMHEFWATVIHLVPAFDPVKPIQTRDGYRL